jgi:hypothetical protein
MTLALITVDTELSLALHQQGVGARANADSSVFGRCMAGDFGIGWQMDQMEAHGLRGIFFVDPLPALVFGEALIADLVGPILARGHDVQLHIHTEWLQWALHSPVGARQGRSIADFSRDDQVTLLSFARDVLQRTGATGLGAFRAGNFGADDMTLEALSAIGLMWDTSFNPGFLDSGCRIELPSTGIAPVRHRGMIEVPVSGLTDGTGRFRAAQICALSRGEMRAVLTHAADHDHPLVTIVTHSFEMLSRDRRRPNRLVMDRFTEMCRAIADHANLSTAVFSDLDPAIADQTIAPLSSHQSGLLITARRMAEQAFATWLYERRLKPA